MGTPLEPDQPREIPPCAVCGARVYFRIDDLTRPPGDPEAETTETRVCSNSECETNLPPRQRRLGVGP